MTCNLQASYLASIAVRVMLSDEKFLSEIIPLNQSRLAEAYAIITGFFNRLNVQYYPASAGVYVWAKLSQDINTWEAEAELAAQLSERNVAISSGRSYSSAEPGWYRLTFALKPKDLEEGLTIIEEVLISRETNSRENAV